MAHPVLVPTKHDSGLSKITLTVKHLIGRALHNSTVIEDVSISRSHCYFERKNNDWFVTDTSSNGTTVNGDLIQNSSRKLNDHDIIVLGSKISYEYLIGSDQDGISDETLNEIADAVLEAKILLEPNPPIERAPSQPVEESDPADDEFQCSICTELFVKAVTLSCSHTFCKQCIDEWRKNQTVCPICRAEIQNQFPTIVLDNYIEKLIEKRSEEYRENRRALIAEREAKVSAMPGPSTSRQSTKRQRSDPIEISSTSSSDSEDDSENDSTYDDGYDCDFDDYFYNGMPGHYYGGYGSCYRCGQKGHWANGCPYKRRR